MHSGNFKTLKNKESKKTHKQMKKLREDFNKHQTETKAHYKKGDI
jgi:hypothetical protein